jgi:hypothetical protein
MTHGKLKNSNFLNFLANMLCYYGINSLSLNSLSMLNHQSSCVYCAHESPSGCSADEGAECSLELPKRVFLPWHSGIFLCDYLLNGETLETVNTVLPLQSYPASGISFNGQFYTQINQLSLCLCRT